MAIDLRNSSGESIQISNGHWAVYLTLAEAFGWKPQGTSRPPSLPPDQPWSGQYASSDGQIVMDAEAKLLAQILHAAAVHPKIEMALTDVIARIESQIESSGTAIPAQMRMTPNDFSKEFSPLLMFLYKGEFVIA
ncbi:hypothetical protein QWZ02_07250 [Kinneretia asaccharophila]|uniref:hypothetical protein n=1 Tax=Roseateles asaccharophilus TaxID=582607 RepID=UPI00105BC694|nr:hypothetical protein [Roseateles asaccharophilus]MDN3544243.1 hypothetical protein [Roseateles asaccharophilus]